MKARKPIPRKRKGPPRRGPVNVPPERWRNPRYLRFLREEGICHVCQIEDERSVYRGYPKNAGFPLQCDPMHGPPNGKSQKGPDAEAMPGCRWHHDEQTEIGWPAFEAKYRFDRGAVAEMWWQRFLEEKGESN